MREEKERKGDRQRQSERQTETERQRQGEAEIETIYLAHMILEVVRFQTLKGELIT